MIAFRSCVDLIVPIPLELYLAACSWACIRGRTWSRACLIQSSFVSNDPFVSHFLVSAYSICVPFVMRNPQFDAQFFQFLQFLRCYQFELVVPHLTWLLNLVHYSVAVLYEQFPNSFGFLGRIPLVFLQCWCWFSKWILLLLLSHLVSWCKLFCWLVQHCN